MTIYYLFNCATAFTDDAEGNLIFSDEAEMEKAIESANKLKAQEFQNKFLKEYLLERFLVNFSLNLENIDFFELSDDVNSRYFNVFMIYDFKENVHYFFENII